MSSNTPSFQSETPVTVKIVQEIAEQQDVDPSEVEPPLHSVIDTEALERLFSATNGRSRRGRLTFEYNGYTVTVEANEAVSVELNAGEL